MSGERNAFIQPSLTDAWLAEPAAEPGSALSPSVCPQQLLFGNNPQKVCDEIRLGWACALDLYRDGFLSFSPAVVERMDEAQEMELRFVGTLARTGCTRHMLAQILRGLSYPYAYSFSSIFYDWAQGQWRPLPERAGTA